MYYNYQQHTNIRPRKPLQNCAKTSNLYKSVLMTVKTLSMINVSPHDKCCTRLFGKGLKTKLYYVPQENTILVFKMQLY